MYVGPWQEYKLFKILMMKEKVKNEEKKKEEEEARLSSLRPSSNFSDSQALGETIDTNLIEEFKRTSGRVTPKNNSQTFSKQPTPQQIAHSPAYSNASGKTAGSFHNYDHPTAATSWNSSKKSSRSQRSSGPPGANSFNKLDESRISLDTLKSGRSAFTDIVTAQRKIGFGPKLAPTTVLKNNYKSWRKFEMMVNYANKAQQKRIFQEYDPPNIGNYVDKKTLDYITKPPLNRVKSTKQKNARNTPISQKERVAQMRELYGLAEMHKNRKRESLETTGRTQFNIPSSPGTEDTPNHSTSSSGLHTFIPSNLQNENPNKGKGIYPNNTHIPSNHSPTTFHQPSHTKPPSHYPHPSTIQKPQQKPPKQYKHSKTQEQEEELKLPILNNKTPSKPETKLPASLIKDLEFPDFKIKSPLLTKNKDKIDKLDRLGLKLDKHNMHEKKMQLMFRKQGNYHSKPVIPPNNMAQIHVANINTLSNLNTRPKPVRGRSDCERKEKKGLSEKELRNGELGKSPFMNKKISCQNVNANVNVNKFNNEYAFNLSPASLKRKAECDKGQELVKEKICVNEESSVVNVKSNNKGMGKETESLKRTIDLEASVGVDDSEIDGLIKWADNLPEETSYSFKPNIPNLH